MNKDNGENNKQQPIPEHPENDDGSEEEILLEVIGQDQYALSYTFFIIPELTSFELTGELIETLPKWLKEISEKNGWKLEFVTVNPQYLQWAITVSTSVITSQVVIQTRNELSKLILATITMDLNNSTDIWAPGYLLLHGMHQDVSGIIEQYIRLIREQQRPSV
ncbi:MAG TPA: transposase [Anaerolineales bacterium]|nr:transposase [Anaerolineales bacterium]